MVTDKNLILNFFFLAMPCCMWDLSFLTSSEHMSPEVEARSLNH